MAERLAPPSGAALAPSANGMFVAVADYEALVRKFVELAKQAEYLFREVEQGNLNAADA